MAKRRRLQYLQGMMVATLDRPRPVGELLRDWRQRRHLSQLDLSCEAEISTRHLSFMETGRTLPSRGMLLKLSEQLEIPLRERNTLLAAAGYAPLYAERELTHPAMEASRRAIELVLQGHEPYPALTIDRHWNMVAANSALAPLLGEVDAELLKPPINVLRLSLHPAGVAPRIANLPQWRSHLLERLRRQIETAPDPVLVELLKELRGYPEPARRDADMADEYAGVVVPLRLMIEGVALSFFSTTMIFGSPIDITLSELAIECLFPADSHTAELLRKRSKGSGIGG